MNGGTEMDVREKLVDLLLQEDGVCEPSDCKYCGVKGSCGYYRTADRLIANGVTVQEWIPSSEPPTRKDADKYGRVLAMEMGMMELVNYKCPINYPDRFPYWMPLPHPPKGE